MSTFRAERPAAVAGQFYPGRRETLEATVAEAVRKPDHCPTGRVRAIIVPHAGYKYSADTAGKAYGLVAQTKGIKRVLVMAPSHQIPFAEISVGCFSSFETPLGSVPVDVDACQKLVGTRSVFSSRADAHDNEHAIEVQLPFLQTVLPGAEIIPAVCGHLSSDDILTAGRILHEQLWDEHTLWVISSDFTHYGSYFHYVPFKEDVDARLEELDKGAIRAIQATDVNGFLDYVERTGATICGAIPIAVLLAAAGQETSSPGWQLLGYTTSGRLTHDTSHSVSYAAIVGVDDADAVPLPKAADCLSLADKQKLLELARGAIAERLGEENGAREVREDVLSPMLRVDRATFVTLHKKGNLRGCIGNLAASDPLFLSVMENAQSAAFRDPRFPALTARELKQIDIEISVLTPPCPVESFKAIEIGRHGIIMSKAGQRAVFLPQVAPEQGWDLETTLTHLALKAGLQGDAWRRGAHFEVFEAIVFGENDVARIDA